MKYFTFLTSNTKLTFLLVILFSFLIANSIYQRQEQQFSHLANSFLHGKTYFITDPGRASDTTYYLGKYYWPLGPFPAVVLMPLVSFFGLFNIFFYQGYLQFFLVIGVFYLCLKIAQRFRFSLNDATYLAITFVFASAFIGVALISFSWYFSQVIVVLLILAALYEFLTKKRYLLIGIYYALILATRISASLGVLLFVTELIFSKSDFKVKKLLGLIVPMSIALILLLMYNFVRFGDILEQGYTNQLIAGATLKAREYGLFNIVHLPGNLYYLLLAGPLPIFKDGVSHVLTFPFIKLDEWGMSIFVTSPMFIYLFFLKYKDTLSKLLWLTVIIVALPSLLYYGIGYIQFGYRYSLDFLPYLFFLLIRNYSTLYRKLVGSNHNIVLSRGFKMVIIISILFNLYLFSTTTI